MSGSTKYIVQTGGPPLWWPITKPTNRNCAHRLAARLGPEYRVFNLITRRPSSP